MWKDRNGHTQKVNKSQYGFAKRNFKEIRSLHKGGLICPPPGTCRVKQLKHTRRYKFCSPKLYFSFAPMSQLKSCMLFYSYQHFLSFSLLGINWLPLLWSLAYWPGTLRKVYCGRWPRVILVSSRDQAEQFFYSVSRTRQWIEYRTRHKMLEVYLHRWH